MSDDADLLRVLHALRLVGFGGPDAVSHRSGLPEQHAVPLLASAAASGWVVYRDGRMTGWSLTTTGRSHGQSLLAAELERLGIADLVAEVYEAFRPLNARFLALCTDWQLRPDASGNPRANDHTDQRYDRAVIARLSEIDEEVRPQADRLATTIERFSSYPVRLTEARRRVEAGERDWFTRPVIDSYHTVWFELHEDLLATLGLERSNEH